MQAVVQSENIGISYVPVKQPTKQLVTYTAHYTPDFIKTYGCCNFSSAEGRWSKISDYLPTNQSSHYIRYG